MRLNKFLADVTGISRRSADRAITEGRVRVNNAPASLGMLVSDNDTVQLDGRAITPVVNTITIMLNKPAGYVVSRRGQGSKTIYDLLPPELHSLKPIGRLDKNSSGLLLLTSDGMLANKLTHPRYGKTKVYEVKLDTPLRPLHRRLITSSGVQLEDGVSKLGLERIKTDDDTAWAVTMSEGRNRQIRRTFAVLGYKVTRLHRTKFGDFALKNLPPGSYLRLEHS